MNDYSRIERVIRYLDREYRSQPSLDTLAAVAGVSAFHFQRLFSRWAGVSPKSFLQCLTHAHAKRRLEAGSNVLDASLDVGLSGPGRLHDLCVKLEAATPGEIKAGAKGWQIFWGIAESPFGRIAVAEGPRGICHLSFLDSENEVELLTRLRRDWLHADFVRNDTQAKKLVPLIFRSQDSALPKEPLRAFVKGSKFQLQVWQALLEIPSGELSSYSRLARSIDRPRAMSAVGTAVGSNPIAYLIPCHRVIRECGLLGGYRWGLTLKRAMLAKESLQTATA